MANDSPSAPGDAHRLIGKLFAGRYNVTGLIGKGGMSSVYSATHNRLHKTVALKVLAKDFLTDDKQIMRFTQEAKACSRLQHPSTIRVFDYGQTSEGLLFIAMELLEGHTLSRLVKSGGAVPAWRACRIMSIICDALAEAHQNGIIHRDLKPDNIFLCADGDGPESLKILDFGIAKVMGETNYETLTQTGYICGTPLYISPEQSLGMQLDGRADLYSVGVMLFELLTGRTPFIADSPIALVMKHIHNDPPTLRVVNPNVSVPKELEELVYRLLSKQKDKRPKSAIEVRDMLKAIEAAIPAPSRQPSAPPSALMDQPAVPRAVPGDFDTRLELRAFDEDAFITINTGDIEVVNPDKTLKLTPDTIETETEGGGEKTLKLTGMDTPSIVYDDTVKFGSDDDPDKTRVELDPSLIMDTDELPNEEHGSNATQMMSVEMRERMEELSSLERQAASKGTGWIVLAAVLVIGVIAVALATLVPWDRMLSAESAAGETDPVAEVETGETGEKTPEADADSNEGSEQTASTGDVKAPVRDTGSGETKTSPQPSPTGSGGKTGNTAATGPVERRAAETQLRQARRATALEANHAAAPSEGDAPGPRKFLIESVPSRALVVIRGDVAGRTPFTFEATAETMDTTLIVSRRGYLPETWQYLAKAAPPPGQNKVKLVLRAKKPKRPRTPKVVWED